MCSRRLVMVPLTNSRFFQVLLGYLDLQVSLPVTSRWILDVPVIWLVGNATLGNHSTSNAVNATMNGSVNPKQEQGLTKPDNEQVKHGRTRD